MRAPARVDQAGCVNQRRPVDTPPRGLLGDRYPSPEDEWSAGPVALYAAATPNVWIGRGPSNLAATWFGRDLERPAHQRRPRPGVRRGSCHWRRPPGPPLTHATIRLPSPSSEPRGRDRTSPG